MEVKLATLAKLIMDIGIQNVSTLLKNQDAKIKIAPESDKAARVCAEFVYFFMCMLDLKLYERFGNRSDDRDKVFDAVFYELTSKMSIEGKNNFAKNLDDRLMEYSKCPFTSKEKFFDTKGAHLGEHICNITGCGKDAYVIAMVSTLSLTGLLMLKESCPEIFA